MQKLTISYLPGLRAETSVVSSTVGHRAALPVPLTSM